MRLTFAIALLLVTAGLAGCLGDDTEQPTEPLTPAQGASNNPATAPPVIAVIDSGINPYHVTFQRGPNPASVPAIAEQARPLQLSLDAPSYDAAVQADAEAWSSIETGELVTFPGTRVAGVSLRSDHVSSVPGLVLDDDGHGTLVGHTAIEAAPDAVMVMVQIPDDEQLVDAMHWVAEQPWIDIVSVSWGNNPHEYTQGEVMMGLPEAYRQAHAAGKLILNGAGNAPVPHWHGEHAAPPFVVAVGGAQNETRGESVIASKVPDVVSDFWTDSRATHDSRTETAGVAGTSLATPRAAGTVAQALYLVREAGGEATAQDLRTAMNRTAILWGAGDYQAPEDPRVDDETIVGASLPVVAGPAQLGWGYVGPQLAPTMAGFLLGQEDVPEKGAEVHAFMAAQLEVRKAGWG